MTLRTTFPRESSGQAGQGEPYDAGNQRHVQKRVKAAKLREQRYDEDFRWLMADRRGRRLVWAWLTAARIYESSMGVRPEFTAFNEGRRNAGLVLLADVTRLCPAQYATMMIEAQVASDLATPKPENTGDEDDRPDTAS